MKLTKISDIIGAKSYAQLHGVWFLTLTCPNPCGLFREQLIGYLELLKPNENNRFWPIKTNKFLLHVRGL